MKQFILFYLFFAIACIGFASNEVQTPIANPYSDYFEKAYRQHPEIPKGVLEAVAYTNSHFYHITHNAGDEISCIGLPFSYGVMGLMLDGKNYFRNNLKMVSKFSGVSEQDIITDPQKNILAYADAYSEIQKQLNAGTEIEKQIPVLVALSELPDNGSLQNNFAMNSHLYSVLTFLNNTKYAEAYNFPQRNIDLVKVFGEDNLRVLSSSFIKVYKEKIIDQHGQEYKFDNGIISFSADYPPALWNPAASCNYTIGRTAAISAVVIHDTEGSYATTISWFQNCSSVVSAHYVLRSSDGQITQMVLEANKAWHVGSENSYTIGLEHEGYAAQTTWYTAAMYQSSANLVKDICNSGYGINPLRCYYGPSCSGSTSTCQQPVCITIKGHQMYPSQTHTDPGINWNWYTYYDLINNTTPVTTLSTATGNFYDSGGATGNYTNDERTLTLISPAAATSITLTFSSFNLDVTDHMYIYDGNSLTSPLIGTYTGTAKPGPITSTGGSLLIQFRSDCSTISTGWAASWTSTGTSTGIGNPSSDAVSVTVYPNPLTSDATINYRLATNAPVQIKLTDILGKEILIYENKNESTGKHSTTLNSKQLGLAKGIYILRFMAGEENISLKLINAE